MRRWWTGRSPCRREMRDLQAYLDSEVDGDTSWRVRLDPRVWKQDARLLTSGARIRGAGRDTLQLGGDVVVAADGTVADGRPQRRDDRPPVAELVTVIEDPGGG